MASSMLKRLLAPVLWVSLAPVAACSRPLAVVAHVPNPLVVAASERADVTYDLTIWIKDGKSPVGLAKGSTGAGLNARGDDHAYTAAWIDARQYPQSARLRASESEGR